MDTLRLALEDTSGKIAFVWDEKAAMEVEIHRASAPNYEITVESKKEPDISGLEPFEVIDQL